MRITMGLLVNRSFLSKAESLDNLEYLVNPGRDEFWRFFNRNHWKAVWNDSEETYMSYKLDDKKEESSFGFLRASLDVTEGLFDTLYVWNPYERNHEGFAKFMGLNHYVPLYLTDNPWSNVFVSEGGLFTKNLALEYMDDAGMGRLMKKSKSLQRIFGKFVSFEFGTLR